jgi:hypothetical protein
MCSKLFSEGLDGIAMGIDFDHDLEKTVGQDQESHQSL